jgi:UDP-N-acetylmuramoyl-L-alanyl-D-glutamate--2,6-diaminopimelate ligase
MNLKNLIKNFVGKKSINYFHGIKGIISANMMGNPAKSMRTIGITGTKGKTSTTMILGRLMNLSGVKTGYISTGSIYLGNKESKAETIKKLNQIKQKIKDALSETNQNEKN